MTVAVLSVPLAKTDAWQSVFEPPTACEFFLGQERERNGTNVTERPERRQNSNSVEQLSS